MNPAFAWIITKDFRAVAELARTGRCEDNSRGLVGPVGASPLLIYALERGHLSLLEVASFRLWNEGDKAYRGLLASVDPLDESALSSPLREMAADFAVSRLTYVSRPEWTYALNAQGEVEHVRVEEQPQGDQSESRGDRR